MPIRYLLYLVLGYLLFLALRWTYRSLKGRTAKRGPGPDTEGEELVQDPVCGTYIPRSTAIARRGRYFCSPQCAEAFDLGAGSGSAEEGRVKAEGPGSFGVERAVGPEGYLGRKMNYP